LSSYGLGQTIRCLKTILCKFLAYFYKYSVEKFYNLYIVNIDKSQFIMATQGKDNDVSPIVFAIVWLWVLFFYSRFDHNLTGIILLSGIICYDIHIPSYWIYWVSRVQIRYDILARVSIQSTEKVQLFCPNKLSSRSPGFRRLCRLFSLYKSFFIKRLTVL
jgi:hypothetical protein